MALNINGTTGISGVDGSVSAPAVTGTDSNTGITFPAADTIKFSTGGVERMQITNSGVSGTGISSGGLPMVDMWHVSSTSTFNTETAAVNWGRSSGTITGAGHIGSAMTNSTQYFTFPETGIYEVEYQTLCYTSAAEARYVASFIYATTDGSNYNKRARGYAAVHQDSSQTTFSFGAKYIFDVTNTSTHKVYFSNLSEVSTTLEHADLTNDIIRSYALFKKLGDT